MIPMIASLNLRPSSPFYSVFSFREVANNDAIFADRKTDPVFSASRLFYARLAGFIIFLKFSIFDIFRMRLVFEIADFVVQLALVFVINLGRLITFEHLKYQAMNLVGFAVDNCRQVSFWTDAANRKSGILRIPVFAFMRSRSIFTVGKHIDGANAPKKLSRHPVVSEKLAQFFDAWYGLRSHGAVLSHRVRAAPMLETSRGPSLVEPVRSISTVI